MNILQLKYQRDLYHLLLDAENQNTDEILPNALKLIVKISEAHFGYLELRNHDDSNAWWSCEYRNQKHTVAIGKNFSAKIISEAITTGKTILTQTTFSAPDSNSISEKHSESVLCFPFGNEDINGIVYLQGEINSLASNNHEMTELEIFARHITPLLHLFRQKANKTNENYNDLYKKYNLSNIVGESPALISKLREAMSIADLDVTVLLTGETGTGKSALAKAIHKNSLRKDKPFIHLNCANIPEQLIESELFGAAKGAYSGAYTDIKGKIATAKGGTLFLDEIGALTIPAQSKLLQFIDDGNYCQLGSSVVHKADVRIIAASSIDFKDALLRGTFKTDLYYRLCIFPIEMPSICDRKSDIIPLVKYFVDLYCKKYKIFPLKIDSKTLFSMQEYQWNGNVREIENKVQQGILRARIEKSSRLLFNHLFPKLDEIICAEVITYRKCKHSWERDFLGSHLRENKWNISETAKRLNISRSHLNNLIKIHNLERQDCILNIAV